MEKARFMLIFLMIAFTFAGCDNKNATHKPDREKVKTPIEIKFYNEQLHQDAKNGITDDNFYYVLTDSVTPIYTTGFAFVKNLPRGSTFYHQFKRTRFEGFLDIVIDGKPYVISRRAGGFQQEVNGMKYPLFGITTNNSQYVILSDYLGEPDTMYLPKGTPYLYVMRNEVNYINFLNPKTHSFQTAAFCCEVDIVQANDHKKILTDYRTKMRHIY
jgi:hypothetical protein